MKMLRKRSGLATLLAIALLLAACGGGDDGTNEASGASQAPSGSYTADEYATAVCTALGTWLNGIKSASESMPTPTNADEAKDVVVTFLDGLVTSTETMISSVEDASSQYSEGNAEAKASVQESLQNVKTIFEDARDTVAGMSTSDPQAFGQALQDVGTSMQDASSEATSSLDSITDQELNGAFASSPACTSLSGSMEASPAA